MPSPPPKRQFQRSSSGQSTAEYYGNLYGLDEATQLALATVGRRARHAVSTGMPGRTMQATQSMSALPSSFTTDYEARQQAQTIINREDLRARELQPYGSPALSANSGYGNDDEMSVEEGRSRHRAVERDGIAQLDRSLGNKREGEDDDTSAEAGPSQLQGLGFGARSPNPTLAQTSPAVNDDFPPVFASPHMTHPELFQNQQQAQPAPAPAPGSMAPPPLPPYLGTNRAINGLPRRNGLGSRAASAPVGRLPLWSGMDTDMDAPSRPSGLGANGFGASAASTSTSAQGRMAAQVEEEEEEDGFDVGEWAASETF